MTRLFLGLLTRCQQKFSKVQIHLPAGEKKRGKKEKINAQASINNITLVDKAECVHEDLVRDTGNPAFE